MNWYYIDESITSDDRRQGPFSKEDILELAERKIITAETLIWHTGLADWKLWKELKLEIEKEQANVIIQQTLEALIQEKKLQVKQNQFAGFWIRAFAYSIDICILTIIACITMILLHYSGLLDTAAISAFFSLSPEELQDNDKLLELFQARGMQLFLWLTSITQFLYFFLCNWKFDATPGKLLLKIKIIRADGTRLGLTGSLLRFFCASLSSFSFVYLYGLAYIVALVDPEKRTFHDWVAKTRVVYKNSEK
ncbi:MAG: RDD family protein [Fibrobacteraceae bacterium]|nr:RDD family protein [Fibrobacteraceae bacterium]